MTTLNDYLHSDEYPSHLEWYLLNAVGMQHFWSDLIDNIEVYFVDRDFGDEDNA